jgi:hypothetical protein
MHNREYDSANFAAVIGIRAAIVLVPPHGRAFQNAGLNPEHMGPAVFNPRT